MNPDTPRRPYLWVAHLGLIGRWLQRETARLDDRLAVKLGSEGFGYLFGPALSAGLAMLLSELKGEHRLGVNLLAAALAVLGSIVLMVLLLPLGARRQRTEERYADKLAQVEHLLALKAAERARRAAERQAREEAEQYAKQEAEREREERAATKEAAVEVEVIEERPPAGAISGKAPAARSSDAPGRNLAPCPDCGKMVSLRARACPNCGCPFDDDRPARRRRAVREEDIERAVMRTKDLTGAAVVTFVLYLFFWLPGLIVNLMYLSQSSRIKSETGEAPSGAGCLTAMLIIFGLMPAILFFSVCGGCFTFVAALRR